jgi:exopolysaccharide biosynthesis polyprenyl glycosylphosphotransferase
VIRRHAYGFRALLMAADAILACTLLVLLSRWRFGPDWALWWRVIVPEPSAFLAFYAVGWVAILTANGLYRPRARWTISGEAADIARAIIAMTLVTLSVLFLFHLPDVSRLFLFTLFPTLGIATLGSRLLIRKAFQHLRSTGRNARFVLVLGEGPRGQAFAAKLEAHTELGLRIVGFLDDERFELPLKWPHLGSLDTLETVLHERIIDEVAICLPFSMWDRIDAISALCEEEGKIVRIPIDVVERAIASGKVEDLDGTPVFSLVSGPDRVLALAGKRLLDLVGAAIGIVVLLPVFAVVALAVKVDDGGSILFRQRRVGLHGRTFDLIKFRSMREGAEGERDQLLGRNAIAGHAFKIADDPRVTRVGRFLRRTSLDELPQVWNVLTGHMSLVGPRPPLPHEVKGYDMWHRRRLSMKPGITGLWQVRGRREAEFDRWVESDLEYIDRWSLWLDLKILARTLPAALEGR